MEQNGQQMFVEDDMDSTAVRKAKNREAAIRSRQKKKSETETIQFKLDRQTKESTRLKLDNAALRAENQILKRQLHYFEDLFAKKTTQTQ